MTDHEECRIRTVFPRYIITHYPHIPLFPSPNLSPTFVLPSWSYFKTVVFPMTFSLSVLLFQHTKREPCHQVLQRSIW